jgi:oligoendopeptidase F
MSTLMFSHARPLLVVLALGALTLSVFAQERDRSKIPDKYKWNLADLYPSDAAWRGSKDKAALDIAQLAVFKGKLSSSAGTLADALQKMSALDKDISRLYAYAAMLADQDTRDSMHQGMKQEMVQRARRLARRRPTSSPRC